mgnify:CR=1 FL=1
MTKAENAQKLGAKMLLIADNVDEKQKIIMADDGRGRLIHIPTLFINYDDGNRLISILALNKTVKLTLKLEVNVTSKAEIRFWLSACIGFAVIQPLAKHTYSCESSNPTTRSSKTI